MSEKKFSMRTVVSLVFIALAIIALIIAKTTTTADTVVGTAWALFPPLIAIVLALISKEVYSSLFIGIFSGALLYSGFGFEGTVNHIFNTIVGYTDEAGEFVAGALTDSYNMGIIIFLVLLGAMVALMNKAGGSAAFGAWASEHIHTRVGAQFATIALGILIFIDDYFNCLTVGSVMRPVTDKHQISRAKLAYLIDATAAPVCIIAPISSWAAAVAGLVEGYNGFTIFLQAIPYNFYALLTLVFMFTIVKSKTEFGTMRRHELNALKGDLYTTEDRPYANAASDEISSKGTMIDMIVPVIVLIICCVIGMIYTGGFFEGANIIESFSNSDASVGLAYGSFFGIIFTLIFYMIRRIMSFSDFMGCLPEGFKAMVPAILILTFAWTLKGITDSLGSKAFVETVVQGFAGNFMGLLPCIVFIIGCLMAFATGTSWGTFGILIPIVVSVFGSDYNLMIVGISACMAGAVCGDHCSPISDTTIMSSAGAQCNHVNHVSTQLPYAIYVAAISAVTYIVAGFTKNAIISLIVGIVMTIGLTLLIRFCGMKLDPDAAADAE